MRKQPFGTYTNHKKLKFKQGTFYYNTCSEQKYLYKTDEKNEPNVQNVFFKDLMETTTVTKTFCFCPFSHTNLPYTKFYMTKFVVITK
jgi:hypothetical protein